ncbi:MAG: hypothetical protein AAFO69_00965 [Bacteroidota bacterium]
MNSSPTETEPALIDPALCTHIEISEEMLPQNDRMKFAFLSREDYRKEAMRQIKAALASLS